MKAKEDKNMKKLFFLMTLLMCLLSTNTVQADSYLPYQRGDSHASIFKNSKSYVYVKKVKHAPIKAVKTAINQWNKKQKAFKFIYTNKRSKANTLISPTREDIGTVATSWNYYYATNGAISKAYIQYDPDKISEEHLKPSLVFEHELGHVLGLDHVNDKRSVMNSFLNSNKATITKQNVKRVISIYRYSKSEE